MASIVLMRRRVLVAGAALLVASLAIRLIPDTAPESDHAVIDLTVLNVLHGSQNVGAYSRFGWHHPGPLYFQLLSPLYLLSGYRHLSVTVAATMLNLACLVGIVAMLRRQKDSAAPIFVAWVVLVVMYLLRMTGLLASPWNPHVVVLALMCLIVTCASVSAGAIRLLPIAALLATFVIQTHLGTALPTVAVIAVTVAATLIRSIRSQRARLATLRRPALISIALLSVLWLLPLADEFRASGLHNLRQLTQFFQTSHQVNQSSATSAFAHFVVSPFSPHLALSWGASSPPSSPWISPLAVAQVVLLLAVAIIEWIRKNVFRSALAFMSLVTIVAAYVAVRRLPEDPKDYTILWISALGVLAWTSIGSLAIEMVAVRRLPLGRGIVRTAILIFALLAVIQGAARRAEDSRISRRIEELTQLAERALDANGQHDVFVHVPEDRWGPVAGIILQLERHGKRVTVDSDWLPMFGERHAPTGRETATLTIADADEHQRSLQYRSNEQLLGVSGPLFVYLGSPPPRDLPRVSPAVLNSHETIGDAHRLTFIGPSAYVDVRVPAGLKPVAIRIVGEPGSRWRVMCVADASQPTDIGDVLVGAGGVPSSGESWLKDLPNCRMLRIQATSATMTQWLAEVELLYTG